MTFMKDNTYDKTVCRNILKVPLCSFGGIPLIDLCARASCTRMLSLPYCQAVLDERWYGVLVYLPRWIHWPTRMFSPIGLAYVEYKYREHQRNMQINMRSTISKSILLKTYSFDQTESNRVRNVSLASANAIINGNKKDSKCNCFPRANRTRISTDPHARSMRRQAISSSNTTIPQSESVPPPMMTIYDQIVGISDWTDFPRTYFLICVYGSPSTKFFLYSLFHMIFLVSFSYMCLFRIIVRITVTEVGVMAYVCTYALEEFRQVVHDGLRDGVVSYFQDYWNYIDWFSVGAAGIAFGTKMTAPDLPPNTIIEAHDPTLSVARNFYLVSLTLFYIRTLHITSISKTIGPRLKMMGDMLRKDLIPLLVVFTIIVFAYGVWSQGLIYPNSFYETPEQRLSNPFSSPSSNRSLAENQRLTLLLSFSELFRRAFYHIFELSTILEEETCEGNNYCGNDLGFVIVIYFVFVLYAGIMNLILINLLIALFSNTVSRVEQASTAHWLAGRYKMVKEYSDRTFLPPPLNALCVLYELCHCCLFYARRHLKQQTGQHKCDSAKNEPNRVLSDLSFDHKEEMKVDECAECRHMSIHGLRNTRKLDEILGHSTDEGSLAPFEADIVLKFILLQSFTLQDKRQTIGLTGTDLTGRGTRDAIMKQGMVHIGESKMAKDTMKMLQSIGVRLEKMDQMVNKVLNELDIL